MKNRVTTAVCILVIMTLALRGLSILPTRAGEPSFHVSVAQQPHSSITIGSNDDFANQSIVEGWSGNGSASNPYVIENYTIQDPSYCICISQVSVSFVVRECVMVSTSYVPCVIFSSTSNGRIEACVVQSLFMGVEFYFANNCIVDSTRIEGSREVLTIKNSWNCTFANNTLVNGGVLLDSYDVTGYQHTFFNNTVMGGPLGYFSGLSDQGINASSFTQLIVVNCTSLIISGGNIFGVPYGALMVACQDCWLSGCTAYDSGYGVVVLECDKIMVAEGEFRTNEYCGAAINRSSNCIITNCVFYWNYLSGIVILGPNASVTSSNVYQNAVGIEVLEGWPEPYTIGGIVMGNTIRQNIGYGIWLAYGVSGYQLFSNIFDSNYPNAQDDGSGNTWDNGLDTGNQWSDYSGYGTYQIPGSAGSVDHYPRVAYANTTNGITDGLPIQDLVLAIWFSLSIAVVSIPVYLMIRTRRYQSGETGL